MHTGKQTVVQPSLCRACNTDRLVGALTAGAHSVSLTFLLKCLSKYFVLQLVKVTLYCKNAFYQRPLCISISRLSSQKCGF